jgi:hypothetical protein
MRPCEVRTTPVSFRVVGGKEVRLFLFGIALLLAICPRVQGYHGFSSGSGHSIQLLEPADVRLASEDVTITPICGPSATTHLLNFRCVFVLQNLSSKALQIQVGFPLDQERQLIRGDDTELVLSSQFIVRDSQNTYHVRHVSGPPLEKDAHAFAWGMKLEPNETKRLHVGYTLRMASDAGATRKLDGQQEYEKPWHRRVEMCMILGSLYFTESAIPWAGPIKQTTVRYGDTSLEDCLRKSPEYVGANPADLPPGTELPDEDPYTASPGSMADLGFVYGLKLGTLYRHITPDRWERGFMEEPVAGRQGPEYLPDAVVWRPENVEPASCVRVMYCLLSIPEASSDCRPWVQRILGKKPRKDDVLELREIAAAFYGIPPHTPSVKRFVEQQIWFDPKRKIAESEATESQRSVLICLSTIAEGVPDARGNVESKRLPSNDGAPKQEQQTGQNSHVPGSP